MKNNKTGPEILTVTSKENVVKFLMFFLYMYIAPE